MAVSAVLIVLHLCLVVLLVPSTISVKGTSDSRAPPSIFCRRNAGQSCKPGSTYRDCCTNNMECQTYPEPGTNNNSTGTGTCCFAKDMRCPKEGDNSCCPGYSCAKASNGNKCMLFLAESSNH